LGRVGFGSVGGVSGLQAGVIKRVLRSVADPDPGYGAFLTTGYGIGFFRVPLHWSYEILSKRGVRNFNFLVDS
jgi:hypothetical protein